MSIQIIFYISTVLFLVGIVGLFVSRDIITIFVTYQLIIVAAIINFLSFSIHGEYGSQWGKIFLIMGSITIYLLIFAVFFFIYSNIGIIKRQEIIKDHRLLIPEKSNWWGEDSI